MNRVVLVVLLFTACAFGEDEVANAQRGVALLRDKMRDPDSLVIEHVYAKMDHKPDHPLMCIGYRAKNAFGGYGRQMAEYKGGDSVNADAGNSIGWCAGIERNWNRASRRAGSISPRNTLRRLPTRLIGSDVGRPLAVRHVEKARFAVGPG
jgi:hypothetical protein